MEGIKEQLTLKLIREKEKDLELFKNALVALIKTSSDDEVIVNMANKVVITYAEINFQKEKFNG